MSDDGLSDCLGEPNMEIQIDTLMGTSFDMRVSSTDTVREIKQRIQRVEGIPIHQQNLIFQSKELKDSRRLCDVGIRNGSTIRLVLSMKGGPISTRRLSVSCEHHMMFKELRELLECTSRDDVGERMSPGSKVSLLVFKDGDIVNLLRVIENEDGSYSPYSEKPISPPSKPHRRETAAAERTAENADLTTKITTLKKKISDAQTRRQHRQVRSETAEEDGEAASSSSSAAATTADASFELLNEHVDDFLNSVEWAAFGRKYDDYNLWETEAEVALKDKHRTKYNSSQIENYARSTHKKAREMRVGEASGHKERKTKSDKPPVPLPPTVVALEEKEPDICLPSAFNESIALPKRSTVHLTRLVLASEGGERPKSTPDSIELEENAQDLWEIHEPAAERLKHSATCKLGVLKRRQSIDYSTYEGIDNPVQSPNHVKSEIGGEFNYTAAAACNNSDFEVCSGNFFRHMPQLMTSPGTLPVHPPQFHSHPSPKEEGGGVCDYYFRNDSSSPLYRRKTTDSEPAEREDFAKTTKLPEIKGDRFNSTSYSFLSDCSGQIQRLKNDCADSSEDLSGLDDLYKYYNLDKVVSEEMKVVQRKRDIELPPVIKKKARCGECNKRLNITNIYNCRCGKIFCSQHRYSEVHHCTYDYKTEGRRILEHQNPLVTADKISRI